MQTETFIYIATERVAPLRWHIKRKSLSAETLKWGLFGVGVSFGFKRIRTRTNNILPANYKVHQ
jgi:hypothetical protein